MEVLFAALLGVVIGLSVGALGGGGAVLAVPLLVYALGEPVHEATTASLLVVAAAGLLGGWGQARAGLVCWDCVVVLSLAAAAGSVGGTALNSLASGNLILIAFVPVLLAAAIAIWRSGGVAQEETEVCPNIRPLPGAVAGLSVGLLIGFFGVGGGFLVVPLMVFGLAFPLRRAVATSIVVIGIVSVISLAVHLAAGSSLDLPVALTMALGAGLGALLGSRIGPSLPRTRLAAAFAALVFAVAAWLLISVLALGGPPH